MYPGPHPTEPPNPPRQTLNFKSQNRRVLWARTKPASTAFGTAWHEPMQERAGSPNHNTKITINFLLLLLLLLRRLLQLIFLLLV